MAIGTGAYDGGWAYEGELLLLNLGHGRRRVAAGPPACGTPDRLAYLEDEAGPALVHTGCVHDYSAGLLPGSSFVVRRAFPTGELRWAFTTDHQATAIATAIEADGDLVYVAFHSGEFMVLRAMDGAVLARQELRVNGHLVVRLRDRGVPGDDGTGARAVGG